MSRFSVAVLTAHPVHANDTSASMTKIDGREALLKSVELFLNREPIKQILLVVSEAAADAAKQKFGAHLGFSGVKLVTGGASWFDQVSAVAGKLDGDSTHILLHDAARPAVSYIDLEALLDAAPKHPCVGLAIAHRGIPLDAPAVPGPAKIVSHRTHELVTPMAFDKKTFSEVAHSKQWPASIQVMESSPLNARCGSVDASVMKAMIQLLPKPKIKASNNPFEEAQW